MAVCAAVSRFGLVTATAGKSAGFSAVACRAGVDGHGAGWEGDGFDGVDERWKQEVDEKAQSEGGGEGAGEIVGEEEHGNFQQHVGDGRCDLQLEGSFWRRGTGVSCFYQPDKPRYREIQILATRQWVREWIQSNDLFRDANLHVVVIIAASLGVDNRENSNK